ncbi:MAG: hypothetical protein F9K43_27190, partial [Bauldia sp.]
MATGRGLPDWTQGTATIVAGQRNVSFTGAGIVTTDPTTGAQIYAAGRGDLFLVDGVDAVPIANVVDASTVQLVRPWTAATQTNVAYAIIRMSIPATGSIAKAIKDLLDQGSDSKPDLTRTCDDGTARIKIDPHSGAPAIRVGAANAPDAALLEGVRFDQVTGAPSFPSGVRLPVVGFRNRLINGDLSVWQRGDAPVFSIGGIGPDMIRLWSNTAGWGVGKIAAPAGFVGQHAIAIGGVAKPAGSVIDVRPAFEGQMVHDLDGEDVTLSFDLSATTSAGTLTGAIYLFANAGLDDGSRSQQIAYSLFAVPAGIGRVIVPIHAASTVGIKN